MSMSTEIFICYIFQYNFDSFIFVIFVALKSVQKKKEENKQNELQSTLRFPWDTISSNMHSISEVHLFLFVRLVRNTFRKIREKYTVSSTFSGIIVKQSCNINIKHHYWKLRCLVIFALTVCVIAITVIIIMSHV